jgi:flagellar biosynthesis protein FliP
MYSYLRFDSDLVDALVLRSLRGSFLRPVGVFLPWEVAGLILFVVVDGFLVGLFFFSLGFLCSLLEVTPILYTTS